MALEEAAVRDALQAELGGATPDDDVLSYAASCLADEDLEWGDAAGGCEGAFEAVGAVLADSLGGDDDAVRALLVRLASRLQLADNAPAAPAADASRLIDLRGIRLAYGGRTLLKPTDFALTRGRRYALVGGNGVGKTTLLTRVAEGNIAGFPPALRRVYVQHEVLARTEQRVRDFMLAGLAGRPGDEEAASEALRSVGFSDALAEAAVSELSGGWRMRLALARSTLQQVDLLLLDEPTNHLDAGAVAWLSEHLRFGLPGVTVLLVSHDAAFLAEVSTDVIHFVDLGLEFFSDGWEAFRRLRPHAALGGRALEAAAAAVNEAASAEEGWREPAAAPACGEGAEEEAAAAMAAAAAALAAGLIKPFVFPDPGLLDGVKSRNRCVLRCSELTFSYPGAAKPTLRAVCARLCLASRVAVVGANGAGKSTLVRLLVGEEALPAHGGAAAAGEAPVWRHHALRVAYVAQHALHHLESGAGGNAVQYMQGRFATGRDREDAFKSTLRLTAEEEALRDARGGVAAICGRRQRGKELFYEVRKTGRAEKDNSWEPLSFLQAMPPYVMKLVRDYDERLKALQGGMEVRPVTAPEVKAHLAQFGIDEQLALSKIRGFSGGQKSRLVLAAALWNKPHLLVLDEPTNYLDRESLAALAAALRSFPGAALVVSHSSAFVSSLCSERWLVEGGQLTVLQERKIED